MYAKGLYEASIHIPKMYLQLEKLLLKNEQAIT